MKSPANFAFSLSLARGVSARGTRPFYDNRPKRNRFDFGRSMTRKGHDDMSEPNREKAIALERALEALREYQKGLPLAKRRGATGTKVTGLLADLERLADRVAAR